jgi:hypothetical protein
MELNDNELKELLDYISHEVAGKKRKVVEEMYVDLLRALYTDETTVENELKIWYHEMLEDSYVPF